jgi:ElaB/YqjD/DUF883 family membrane-anchored ribosome-binding protein
MSNQSNTTSTPFPATQQDVARLKQTAIDAASDLGSTASVHASRAKSQLNDLAGHVREEGGQQLDEVKGKFSDLVLAGRTYVSDHPLSCLGAALTLGFLIGLTRRHSSTT